MTNSLLDPKHWLRLSLATETITSTETGDQDEYWNRWGNYEYEQHGDRNLYIGVDYAIKGQDYTVYRK